jgi:hypothetical protein
MRSSSWIAALTCVAVGCAESADRSLAADPPSTLQEETQGQPNAQECPRLQDQARDDFGAAVDALAIDQCAVDADCNFDTANANAGDASPPPRPFRAFTDACWETCSSTPGTEAYGEALKAIGARVCSGHRAAGCPVHPSGCPFLQPVVMRCVDGACRS